MAGKQKEIRNVINRNSSSWPNMSTGDPVVSSVFAAEGVDILQLQCVLPDPTGRRGIQMFYLFHNITFITTVSFFPRGEWSEVRSHR